MHAYLLPDTFQDEFGSNALRFKVYVMNGKNLLDGFFSYYGILPTVPDGIDPDEHICQFVTKMSLSQVCMVPVRKFSENVEAIHKILLSQSETSREQDDGSVLNGSPLRSYTDAQRFTYNQRRIIKRAKIRAERGTVAAGEAITACNVVIQTAKAVAVSDTAAKLNEAFMIAEEAFISAFHHIEALRAIVKTSNSCNSTVAKNDQRSMEDRRTSSFINKLGQVIIPESPGVSSLVQSISPGFPENVPLDLINGGDADGYYAVHQFPQSTEEVVYFEEEDLGSGDDDFEDETGPMEVEGSESYEHSSDFALSNAHYSPAALMAHQISQDS